MTNSINNKNNNRLYDDIVKYLSNSTTSDPVFIQLSALFTCSVAVQDSVRLKTEYATIKPNLYVMLLGKSTISHKTTLMNLVTELLASSYQDYMISQFSPEGLTKFLSERRKAIIIKDEFGGMLSSMNSKDYMSDAKDLLMELYDNKKIMVRQLANKSIQLKDSYFAMFTGLTPERFLETFSYHDIYSGFLVRFAVGTYRESTKKEKVNLTAHTMQKLNIISKIEDMRKVLQQKQHILVLSDSAEELFNTFTEPILSSEQDELTLALYGRYNIMILKVALIFFVMDHYRDLDNITELPEEYIKEAIEYLQPILEGMLYLLKTITMHPQVSRILEIIRSKKICEHSYVLWKSHLKANELKVLIDTLLQMDMISVKRDKGKTFYILKRDVDEM
ncbi:MAG: DUF3987 domain-containing protein [Candidatus Micrarchaeaceae archaeon]